MTAPINLEDEAVDAAPVEPPPASSSPPAGAAPSDDEVIDMEICPTPDEVALACVQALKQYVLRQPVDGKGASALPVYPEIVEPSAGGGAFVRACLNVWPGAHVRAVEPREAEYDALRMSGAEQVYSTTLESFVGESGIGDAVLHEVDLVVGNPPFSKFTEHVRLLLANMRPGAYLAFILRLGTLASHERVAFWQAYAPETLRVLVPRPGFKLNGEGKKGTDMQEYALFIWHKGAQVTATTLGAPIVWRLPARPVADIPKVKKPRRPRADKGKPRKPRGEQSREEPKAPAVEQKAPIDLE